MFTTGSSGKFIVEIIDRLDFQEFTASIVALVQRHLTEVALEAGPAG